MEQNNSSRLLSLTHTEELLRHNLETRKYWSEKDQTPDQGASSPSAQTKQPEPPIWHLTKNITLYNWQEACVNKWFQEKRGTIKVVTGAGKTILALAIIEKLQAANKNLRAAIVVPTIVLQNQWYDEIINNSNLPPQIIGRLGGDHKDQFSEQIKILICVLNSAALYLPRLAAESKQEHNLLLIADECHKAGASFMQKIFLTKRAYNLGLSATPEREDQYDTGQTDIAHYNQSLLGQELGPIIFELTVKEALQQGILPEFEIHHYGLSLTMEEREKYENLSRRIRDTTKELKQLGHHYGIHDSNIPRRAQELAKRQDELGLVAKQHLYLTNQRRHLLYNSASRQKAVLNILQTEFQTDPTTRALLFHESIESVMLLYNELLKANFPAAVEHSQLPDSVRKTSIQLFREGIAQIIVSARSLIEGFNVPETDMGIIVASSTSVRQRIQTIGRLLRKSQDKKKTATIYVLYMADTIDEFIYGKPIGTTYWGPNATVTSSLITKANCKNNRNRPAPPYQEKTICPWKR